MSTVKNDERQQPGLTDGISVGERRSRGFKEPMYLKRLSTPNDFSSTRNLCDIILLSGSVRNRDELQVSAQKKTTFL